MPEQSTEDEGLLEGVWWAFRLSGGALREMCPTIEGKTVKKQASADKFRQGCRGILMIARICG